MKKLWGVAICLIVLAPVLVAQENHSESPVWRVSLVRVKPNHMDEYLTSFCQSSKPFLEEEKRQGQILDYKFFLKETKNNPQDWDVCLAIQYKNHAALDALGGKTESVRDKIFGGKPEANKLGEKREEIRELVSSELPQEI